MRSPYPQFTLERHRAGDLQRITLKRGSIREFLEVLEAEAELPRRQYHVRRETERVDAVACAPLWRSDGRSCLISGLPLAVADHPELQLRVVGNTDRSRHRVVDVSGLPRMNACAFLDRVKLVHVKRGERGRPVRREKDGHSD